MDFVSSAFQCDPIDDQLLEFSSIPCQQCRIQKDPLQVMSSSCNNDVTEKPDYHPWQQSSVVFDDSDGKPMDYKRKKIIHREAERQRRQEMAALYRSVKNTEIFGTESEGKRSISDHMLVAVDYIRQLQKRVEEKGRKRDELRSSFEPSIDINAKSRCFPSCLNESVTVESSRAGFQITMSTAMGGGLCVSKVLDVLLREGLNVVSCISINVEERLHHVIDSEVGDGTSINGSELRTKLTELIDGVIFE
ncbi:hypothetical protein RHMOL_Rhmol07G0115800 [Rhododendron molle]|uniref:Uncharacterized protein n=1 Tax=Rhododendron molle TaxID=49168 RepID=A0ACC0MZS9_RHOML|nr:hypothetical protein RHMOL_Rhmol07G0115800 [Rhododendron molle]